MRVLSEATVAELAPLEDLLPVVERAFVQQGRGTVERPERPQFPVGIGVDGETDEDGGEPAASGTGLAMPAYLHGDRTYATKLVGVHPDNAARDLPTVHAQLVVSDATTGEPILLAAAERLTNARTAAIGGVATRELAPGTGPVRLGVIGAGTQARWQTRAVDATRGVADARIYSPTPASREACAAELRAEGLDCTAVESARAAVADRDVVVTATTATQPVFDGAGLAPDTLVVAVGAYTVETQELDRATFDRARRIYADVPSEVAGIGDIAATGVDPERLRPFSDLLDPDVDASDAATETGDVTIVESVGSAVLDAAAGELLAERADERDAGTVVDL